MFSVLIVIAFLIAIVVGAMFLQMHLSKKESKWLGLILPIITLAISLMAVMGMAVFIQPGTITHSNLIDGELVTTIISEGGNRERIPGAIGGVIYTFIVMNLPTAVLLIIYAACRGKRNKQRALEKMSVQDL